jgi:hypothetical protein
MGMANTPRHAVVLFVGMVASMTRSTSFTKLVYFGHCHSEAIAEESLTRPFVTTEIGSPILTFLSKSCGIPHFVWNDEPQMSN